MTYTKSELESLKLGQAKNQAAEILSKVWERIPVFEREEIYKKAVKQIYKWNAELDAELFEMKEKAVNSDINTPSDKEKPSPSNIPAPLSDKQKRCLKCRAAIPKTWTRHDECGWSA